MNACIVSVLPLGGNFCRGEGRTAQRGPIASSIATMGAIRYRTARRMRGGWRAFVRASRGRPTFVVLRPILGRTLSCLVLCSYNPSGKGNELASFEYVERTEGRTWQAEINDGVSVFFDRGSVVWSR